MNYQIYFPNDLTRKLGSSRSQNVLSILGYKIQNVYVIVNLVPQNTTIPSKLPSALKDITIVGTLYKNTINSEKNEKSGLVLRYDPKTKLPIAKDTEPNNYAIITFEPPNYKNLEYFSIKPILLQSMQSEKSSDDKHKYDENFELFEPVTPESNQLSIANDVVIDKINSVLRSRKDFEKLKSSTKETDTETAPLANFWGKLLIPIVVQIQRVLISIIWLINYQVHGVNLISLSNVIRQLDLRLRQINYFPIQFLCYYDKTIFYNENNPLLKNLQLPIFNSNLNINNSNYINLHNSTWLIFNDILLGITAFDLLESNFDNIQSFFSNHFVDNALFNKPSMIINWIANDHPAGLKLNDELGRFMGDLFMWSLKCWKFVVRDFVDMNVSSELKYQLFNYFRIFIKVLCYGGGLSFFLGFCIDAVERLTFHISWFCFMSTKVYNRQISTIKSLFQLFRGKKYNVLRNRIDNLNNYVIGASDSFEIDQLLLGTLMFVILVLLLPTVGSFYVMFFLLRLSILITLNFLENIQIVVTFTPIFVLVLKLKNSNRLQGGIKFKYLNTVERTNYIQLSNKSLSYGDILTNYVKLFTTAKNFRTKLLSSLMTGELLTTKRNHQMKFDYLMLPLNYEKTIDIWATQAPHT